MRNNKKAFTLVELIVVITILAVLGTIGFISLQNYTTYARDAVRTSDIGSISRAISLKISAGDFVPKPENAVTITSSGTTVMFQGEFTKAMGSKYGINGDLVDPLDGKNYTYSTDANLYKHELAGFLESGELSSINTKTNNLLGEKTHAAEGRTVYTKGDKLGILLSSDEVPLQELSLPGNTLDIVNTTDIYKVYFDNGEPLEGTGSVLSIVNPKSSCKRILETGFSRNGDGGNGIYTINPAGESFQVYCDMITDGGGWTQIAFEDYNTPVSGWSGTNTITQCGEFGNILGGYGVISVDSNSKTFDLENIPYDKIRVSVDFIKIDSWDHEFVTIKGNGVDLYSDSFGNFGPENICGNQTHVASHNWDEEKIPLIFNLDNSSNTFNLNIGTTLNQPSTDESYGIDNLKILIK